MRGNYLFCSISSLLGLLCSQVHFHLFSFLTFLYFFLLKYYKHLSMKHLSIIYIIFIVFLVVGIGSKTNNHTKIPPSAAQFSIEYLQNPKIDGDQLQVLAKDTKYKEKLVVRYKIKTREEKEELSRTSFYKGPCLVTGALSKPSIGKNPNLFNYRQYLKDKQVFWILEIQKSPLQSCSSNSSPPLVWVKQLRFLGIQYLEHHFPSDIASLSAALIFGDKSLLEPHILVGYQQTGIVHLLAISGLHVSLFIGMVYYLGIRLGITRQSVVNTILLLLPLYVFITGSSPSVIRASLMIFLILMMEKTGKRRKLLPIDSISMAFMLILLFSPFMIFDTGFQLSFSVSYGIILSAPFILRKYHRNVTRLLATSIAAQLSAFPFLLYHFFELSFLGIAANLLYIPLFSFVFLPGVYLMFFLHLLFGSVPHVLIDLFSAIIQLANHLIDYLSSFSITSLIPGRPNWVQLILYILLIGALFTIWEAKPYNKKTFHLLLLSFVLVTFQSLWNFLNPYTEVTLIDVGQGDSILIHFPFGEGNYLIDTGGTVSFAEEKWRERASPFEVGKDVVVPYLKGKGITKINKLILSHGDMDHIGGAMAILSELKVKQILMPSVSKPSKEEQEIVMEAKMKGIPVIKVSDGTHWFVNGNRFSILSPKKNFTGERNRGSIALIAQFGGLSWFFGGDLDQVGEEEIMKAYPHLKIDVLKVGHHGSKTSSSPDFIQQIKPKVALISAGENNRYGHPHKEVLILLEKTHCTIFRTDLQGAISYRFFRGKGTFFPFLP